MSGPTKAELLKQNKMLAQKVAKQNKKLEEMVKENDFMQLELTTTIAQQNYMLQELELSQVRANYYTKSGLRNKWQSKGNDWKYGDLMGFC